MPKEYFFASGNEHVIDKTLIGDSLEEHLKPRVISEPDKSIYLDNEFSLGDFLYPLQKVGIVKGHPQDKPNPGDVVLVDAAMYMLSNHGNNCITFETKSKDSPNTVEKMRIDESGIVVNGDIKVNGGNHGMAYNLETDGLMLYGFGGGYLSTPRDPALGGYLLALTWDRNGNVGIGNKNPSEKLDVDGNVLVNGDIKVTGDILLTSGADCAEDFDIVEAESVQPGMVMVINKDGALQPSEQAYDKRVAGVISGAGNYRPGITLDKQINKYNRLPLALTGKVFCKVDAEYNPVEVGDLLTTSPTIGHAMKADDRDKAFGAVIGKALHELEDGKGLIPVLVALQ